MYKSTVALFITNKITDDNDRTCRDIMSTSDYWLNHEHDWIQWVFPTDEPKKFMNSPVIDEETILEFKHDNYLQTQQKIVLDRVLRLYGLFRLDSSLAPIERSKMNVHNFDWLKEHDHTHLRITRMLRSINLLQSKNSFAKGLCDEFIRIASQYGITNHVAFSHWLNAVRQEHDRPTLKVLKTA